MKETIFGDRNCFIYSRTTEGKIKSCYATSCPAVLHLICLICKYCKIWVNIWSAGLLDLLLTMVFNRIKPVDFITGTSAFIYFFINQILQWTLTMSHAVLQMLQISGEQKQSLNSWFRWETDTIKLTPKWM